MSVLAQLNSQAGPRLCALIPVYRHAAALERFLPSVLAHVPEVILIDDGNPSEDSERLQALARTHGVRLFRREANGGKGAAVLLGIEHARDLGFSHVLQIDADGQHDAADIPLFIERMREFPESMVLGVPQFAADAPRARVWGRELTNGLIALQTWSFAVRDGLFGFRIYPLAAVAQLLESRIPAAGMGFDVDILVRLRWRGIEVQSIASNVRYPEDGFSNFEYLRDNLRLAWLHTRLLLAGLWYGPKRIAVQNLNSTGTPQWYGKKERGSAIALGLLYRLYRWGGRPLLEFLLHPVILYFYLSDPAARRASATYLQRLRTFAPDTVLPTLLPTYFHLHRFGQKVISSLQAWLGDVEAADIDWQGTEEVFALLDQGKGAFVISAHIGCLEVCRATHRQRKGLKIIPLMYLKNAERFRGFLKKLNPAADREVLRIDSINAAVAMQIQQRIAAGEFFAILADRRAPDSPARTLDVSFLGAPAALPEGPFALAMALDCPVFTFFSQYNEETRRYEACWEPLEMPSIAASRAERRAALHAVAQEYARRLERACCRSPLQWFNFFDFWA